MKMLIIPIEIAEKLRNTEFDGFNRLDPVKGDILGKEVYFLQAELYLRAAFGINKVFAKVLADFEVCEIKEIATIEQKYYDKGVEIKPTITTKDGIVTTKYVVDSKEIDPTTLESKTILTEKIIKEVIK